MSVPGQCQDSASTVPVQYQGSARAVLGQYLGSAWEEEHKQGGAIVGHPEVQCGAVVRWRRAGHGYLRSADLIHKGVLGQY